MRFLRDPLLHFLVLGAALLGIHTVITGRFSPDKDRVVTIGEPEVELLSATFERQWNRPPTEEELQGIIDARVREEILYREALAVGLDRDDTVVRRRMVQKMEFLTQDLALLADPTEAELRAYLAEYAAEYRLPPRLTFSQVFFDGNRVSAQRDAEEALALLRSRDPVPSSAPEMGDPIMISHGFRSARPEDVSRVFGSEFSEALFALSPGWQGPLVSPYGLHLVYVADIVPGRAPAIEEVRDSVVRDFNRVRRDRALQALYEGLASRYEVVIE